MAADGTLIATTTVPDRTAVLDLGSDALAGPEMTVVAYDAAGNRLSITPLASRDPLFDTTIDWD